MSACTYRFSGPDGNKVTIVGKAEMKAYMAVHLDFLSAKGNFNFGRKPAIVASTPEPRSAIAGQAEKVDSADVAQPQASRRAFATWTGETPERIRRVLAEEFGDDGITRLEHVGLLRIVPNMDAVPAGVRINGAEAVYDPGAGVVYLVADRLSADRAPTALLHELGEHHGLEGFVGRTGWRAIR
jgi:hypothetical protein